ncbi:hypothetical protein ACWT_6081 [Actinoplanes sp. SE50]|uniref:right-handed parallel beta-helix repeat-containing protein n=1 Tax=unclassified Actinoplanes TaxID=2626549 RepID=UPI00023ECA13|nr:MULTISPECIES: right-handed parallel beta-helix repeat-containing protein [unclassified Actinoplanes]AEV87098.1 ywoF-like uncharacterized protein [Actinoplanes sp. SE50/110]ATO85496.1 hypothetical protein ACWT_6081 [Actinoplanes sp. SE50]SLM02908.1 hypothetical protein ACSP50_6193 [Actinoplanes sp. SE50/110]
MPQSLHVAWPAAGSRRRRTLLIAVSAAVTVAAVGVTARIGAFADDKPAIRDLTLLDAVGNRPVSGRKPLSGDETVDLAALGTRELSVQANPVGKVGSIRFQVDGRTTRVENHQPYLLSGDAENGKDVLPWTPAAGKHTVVVTPYSRADGKGTTGVPIRITLTVIDSAGTGAPARSAGRTAGAGIGGPTWAAGTLAPTQGGRHLYVSATGDDKQSGLTAATALRTLQRAADMTRPGDTVVIGNGTYSAPGRQFVLGIRHSGTPDKWITYASAPGADPRIEAAGWQGVAVNARYIIVTGLTVHGATDRLTAKQKDAARNGDEKDPMINTSCIAVSEPFGGGESTYPHHVRIHGNTVYGCPLVGISAMHSDYVQVTNNLSFGNSNWSPFGGSGISLFEAWNSDGTTGAKLVVHGNVVRDNASFVKCGCSGFKTITDGGGIIVDSFDNRDARIKTPYQGRTLVENNLSYDNGARGINVFRSAHVDVVNNTVYHNGAQPSIQDNMSVIRATDVRVTNNILVSRGAVTAATRSAVTDVTFDSNLIVGTSTVSDPHRRTGDPQFVDPANGDFRLESASPAINSAVGFPVAPVDATGAARTGKRDLGALETH